MAGRPKRRARLAAQEAARKAAQGGVPSAPHSVPMAATAADWIDHPLPPPAPKPPREDIDPLVGSVMPEAGGGVGLIGTEKEHLYTELVGLALERALDIMRIKPGDEGWDKQVLTRQASIVASVLSTTARIDEAKLKGGAKDRVKELLDEIRAMKPRMS